MTLADLAKVTGKSTFYTQRLFRARTGVTPAQYARSVRLKRLQKNLQSGEGVTEAMEKARFGSASRMHADLKEKSGLNASALRSGGKGMEIRYGVADSDLGKMLVAKTKRGVCAVLLGDTETAVEAELRERFRAAKLIRDEEGLEEVMDSVLAHMTEDRAVSRLTLDLRATFFQERVWKALQEIPRGETRSYAELARMIGQPKAVRAVATACGSNPVAVVQPCHRAVGANGSLTGYRWGMERKRHLLALERGGTGLA